MFSVTEVLLEKLGAVTNSMAAPDQLPTVMIIQKGRLFMAQLVQQVDDHLRARIFTNMVATLPIYVQKVPNDSVNNAVLS